MSAPSQSRVLHGIDLVLEPGTVTALVGPSGSGKSTLVQLLPRFFDPTDGSVLVGGVDLRQIGTRDLYRMVSFVFQDGRLLRASVAENIGLAVPHADRADVIRAARLASIHERILRLPRGYDSVIGVDAELSGGEAQRISIARALLAATPVLVLDEAMAFADPLTEQAVRRALASLKGERTILVIAHRLETVVDAETVVMLERGTIVERGRPAELLSQNGRFAAFWQAQPVLRACGRGAEGFTLLDGALRKVRRASRQSVLAMLPGAVGVTVAVQVMFTAAFVLGAYLALGGSIGAAEVLTALVLAGRCADPLLSLSDISGMLRGARGELARLDAMLRTEPLPEAREPIQPVRHDLQFESVTFRHGDRTVIDDVSLTVPQGHRLAVVGPSGAGKSTLLRLLARFHDVHSGAVRIGGIDVRAISTDVLMQQVAIVFQDIYLFDGTIEENVRLGHPDATTAEVRAAAAAARLDEVIERLPRGWATTVGEGGTMLSGGERQRVSIARALLKNAPIVLLDEVTSALDPVNEAAVHDGIERLSAGRTVVMVAHRLASARRSDRIVFLDGGSLVEEGSHEELLRRNGRYAGFWSISMVRVADG